MEQARLAIIEHRRRPREQGMALFVVLVVVAVLSVLVSELTISTKIEESIARSQMDYLEISYSFQAVARSVMLKLYEDWLADQDAAAADGAGADPSGASPGAQDPLATGSSSTASGTYDFLTEDWAREYQEFMNEVEVTIQITDGESKIDLNDLFLYVFIPDDDMNRAIPGAAEAEEAALPAPTGDEEGEPDEDTVAEEEEYQMPSEERVDKTILMVERLIEAVVIQNDAAGYFYANGDPDPRSAATAIVRWVESQLAEPETRRIRSIDPLMHLDEISWELFNGPYVEPPDESIESDGYAENFDENGRYVGDQYESQLQDQQSQLPGYVENEDGTGLIPEDGTAKPLGLRHVLTAHSTGLINVNTASREVLLALLIDIEEFDLADEVVAQVVDYRTKYTEEEAGADPAAALGDDFAPDEEEEPALNEGYRNFEEIKKAEDAENPVWESRDEGQEKSIWDFIKEDWERNVVYKSTFFAARLEGRNRTRKLKGELQLLRHGEYISVVSWRNLTR